MLRIAPSALFAFLVSVPLLARADEGMWTFDNFPAQLVGQKYGFTPSAAWLDHVRLSSVRLAGGCSGSFVSPYGLVMTNHHCAHACIEQLSTSRRDYIATGFQAKTEAEEVRCPEIEVNQLLEISDVTDRVNQATRGLSGSVYSETQKAEISRIEKECATNDSLRCDVVCLYHGGLYHLYKYRRFQDVRLAFAPEFAVAFFGGDPDNFEFPRYDLDVSFLRVYQDGKPAQTPDHFSWANQPARAGDLTFVSGNPGSTSRSMTLSQLELERDVNLPFLLLWSAELRGVLEQFSSESAEHKRISGSMLFSLENSFKGRLGRLNALKDPQFMKARAAEERGFQEKVAADPKLAKEVGAAWDDIAQAAQRMRPIHSRYALIEQSRGFTSELFSIARSLVRSEELAKPNEERLQEYTDSKLPALKQQLFSSAPIYDDLEIVTLAYGLSKLRAGLGPDDPFVRAVLGKKSPRELATELVKGTRLKEVKVRRALFEGGSKLIEASKDPMIALARAVDPEARAVRKTYEDEVQAPLKKNGQLIAKARFQLYGTSIYPDGTFSPRLSYGQVNGYSHEGSFVEPFTALGGAFERDTGREPFRLPRSWLAAKPKLDLETSLNVATANDIIGGNSGSPLINKEGEVIGLVFDGNIYSLAGDYAYDGSLNRAVAVHGSGLLEALEKIYGAKRMIQELKPAALVKGPANP